MIMLFVIIEYDRRRSGVPSAPVVIEHDDNRDDRDIPSIGRKQHNPTHSYIHIFTFTCSRTKTK